jgi:aminopeptidase N
MQSAPDLSLRILYYRSFRSIATTSVALARLKSLLAGQSSVPGLEIKPLDRWTMIAALLAHADPDASALLHAEQQVTPSATAASTHTRPARPVPTPPSNSNTSRITWRTVRYRKTGLSRVSPLSTTGTSRL